MQLIFQINALIFLWTDLTMAGATWVQTMIVLQKMCPFPLLFPFMGRHTRVFGSTTTVILVLMGPKLAFRQLHFPIQTMSLLHPGGPTLTQRGPPQEQSGTRLLGPTPLQLYGIVSGFILQSIRVPTHSRSSFQTETMKAWALVTMSAFAT